jgi:hypothetical protein
MPLALALLAWMIGNNNAAPTHGLVHDPAVLEFHVRATDPLVHAWIVNGAAESRALRDLLADLIASDVIVHVELVDRIPGGALGQLAFVTATPTVRYLRVQVVRVAGRADMIALIAHELQHAAEIAGERGVRDVKSMAKFYLGLHENGSDSRRYDSLLARTTESIVRREVLSHRGVPTDELQFAAQFPRGTQAVR